MKFIPIAPLIHFPARRVSGVARLRHLALGCALLLAGCSTPVSQSLSFNEADFAAYRSPGTAVIQGHAFVRTNNGGKHGAAGLKIFLVPLTPYTEERAKIMEAEKDPAAADPRLDSYVRTTVGEWGGAFQFTELPAGDYLLYCKIEWVRPRQGGDYYATARAHVAKGEHKNVVITNLDQK